MRKARIQCGIVCEIMEANHFPPFHPDLVWVECGAEVEQGWTLDGQTFAPPVSVPQEATKESLTAALQAHLDATARERGYDGILSLCSYATSVHPRFGAEGQAGVVWRDAVWAAGYQVVADVEAGKRGIPTAEELVKELPKMVWP